MKKLGVGELNLKAIVAVRPLVEGLRRRDRRVCEQLLRALTSSALYIGRADYQDPRGRRRHLLHAVASTGEARALLKMFVEWGYCAPSRTVAAERLLDQTLSMLSAELSYWG
ncbi:MAG TPA: hypothetical protein VHB79_39330 [Polyangiaceae bacterium]|nr:hypothetical protein [Polyangiaceae bacterium]